MNSIGKDVPLLSIEDLAVTYTLARHRVIRAVRGVSLEVRQGETLGIIGESGSGKSTLGRAIVGLTKAADGRVIHDGRVISELNRREFASSRRDFAFIFQDPHAALNPRMTVGQSVREPLDISGEHDHNERTHLVAEALDRVGLGPDYGIRYPHELSGGQKQRVNIARALVMKPRLIVCDEVVAALDLSIQADILNLFADLQRDLALAYVFISHDLRVIAHVSDQVAVMYLGKIVEMGPRSEIFGNPGHPYTRALISAEPTIDLGAVDPGQGRIVLKGEVPSPIDPPSGCGFRTRCWLAREVCGSVEPPLSGANGHAVACHFAHTAG